MKDEKQIKAEKKVKKYFLYLSSFSFIFILTIIFYFFYQENKKTIVNMVIEKTNNKIFYLRKNNQVAIYSKKIIPECNFKFPFYINCNFNYDNFNIVFLVTKNHKQYQFPLVHVPNLKINISRNIFAARSSETLFNNFSIYGKDAQISTQLFEIFKIAKKTKVLDNNEYIFLKKILMDTHNKFLYKIKKKHFGTYEILSQIEINNFLYLKMKSSLFLDKNKNSIVNNVKFINLKINNTLSFQRFLYLLYKTASLFIAPESLNKFVLDLENNKILSFKEFKKKLLYLLNTGYKQCLKVNMDKDVKCFNIYILKEIFEKNTAKEFKFIKSF